MWLVQGSSRLGYLSARSPTAMIKLLRSPASISLHAIYINQCTMSHIFVACPTPENSPSPCLPLIVSVRQVPGAQGCM